VNTDIEDDLGKKIASPGRWNRTVFPISEISILILSCIQGMVIGKIITFIKLIMFDYIEPFRSKIPIFAPFLGGTLACFMSYVNGPDFFVNFNAVLCDDSKFSVGKQILRVSVVLVVVGSGCSLALTSPAVEIGMTVARIFMGPQEQHPQRSLLFLSGAAAGFSANFDAPLAGLMFALEVTSKFLDEPSPAKPKDLLIIVAGSTMASFFARNALLPKAKTLFSGFIYDSSLLPSDLLIVVALGICGGVIAKLSVIWGKILTSFFSKLPGCIRPICGGVISMCAAACGEQQSILVGYKTLGRIASGKLSKIMTARFLFSKFFCILCCSSSGMIGGIFTPWLVAGGALGGLLSSFSSSQGESFAAWTAIGCTSILSAVIYCPITVTLLLIELTRNTHLCVPFLITSCTATVITDANSWQVHHLI